MARKVLHTYEVAGGSKKPVLEFLSELQALPQHKWIPIEEMSSGNTATVTPRQAGWVVDQVAKKVEDREIEFELVPELVAEEAADEADES